MSIEGAAIAQFFVSKKTTYQKISRRMIKKYWELAVIRLNKV